MPGIDYTLGMKASGFNSGVSGALSKLAGLGAKVAAVTAGAGLAAGVGLGALIAKSIGKAADMETLQTAFAPLLGGAEKAKARIAELAAFAAATPFDLPEIAAASRVLETLTKGALSTGKGLTLVGDIASATNQPFSEIAVSVGRLYDGLQSGRPVGEALQRLQELGVVSGDVRGRIEDLQKEGKKGAEVWDVAANAMGAFTGSMERQSVTWNGLMSTLMDTISMTMAQFGKPIMDSLKPYLTGLTVQIENMQSMATTAGQKIASAFDTAMAAFQTGNVMNVIGDGLSLAVIDAVNTFSSGIRGTMAFIAAALGKILGAIGDGIARSGIMLVFENLANALGSIISASIMATIGKITGWKGWEQDADKERARASNFYLPQAKLAMQGLDIGAGMDVAGAGLVEAWKTGVAEFKKAASTPLLDRSAAADRLAKTLEPVNARIAQNQAKADAVAKALDAKLTGPNPGADGSPAADAAKFTAGRATTDRLAQIGGYVGGAASGLATRLSERTAKATESTVKGIDKLVAYSLRQTTSFPAAVF